jgi:hypothetical protein
MGARPEDRTNGMDSGSVGSCRVTRRDQWGVPLAEAGGRAHCATAARVQAHENRTTSRSPAQTATEARAARRRHGQWSQQPRPAQPGRGGRRIGRGVGGRGRRRSDRGGGGGAGRGASIQGAGLRWRRPLRRPRVCPASSRPAAHRWGDLRLPAAGAAPPPSRHTRAAGIAACAARRAGKAPPRLQLPAAGAGCCALSVRCQERGAQACVAAGGGRASAGATAALHPHACASPSQRRPACAAPCDCRRALWPRPRQRERPGHWPARQV